MRNYSRCGETEIPAQETLGGVIAYLSEQWPAFRKRIYNADETGLRRDVGIIVNGIFVLDETTDLALPLSPTDVLMICEFPAYG